ncbi:calcium-binding protein, partial [Phenylobacterium sp.]|uniref:calcium-binding protein n=1 Tax=Phenylobacterium sp. TaxID=1871053 RepID=UPI002F41EDC9
MNSDLTVAAGTVINHVATGGDGYQVDQGSTGPNFTNLGDITFTLAPGQASVTGLLLASSSIDWTHGVVDNQGHFTISSTELASFLAGPNPPGVTNEGVISVTGATGAVGLNYPSAFPDITNSGVFQVSGDGTVIADKMAGGAVINNAGGVISATGEAVGDTVHAIDSTGGLLFSNSGQVIATDHDPGAQSVAVQFGGGMVIFDNHGTVTGDIAIQNTSTDLVDVEQLDISNVGTINGTVDLGPMTAGSGPAIRTVTMANVGVVNGDVNMGQGDDLFSGQTGIQNGLVSGGPGRDTLLGGQGDDALQGNQGDDSIFGGAGDDIIVGGKDNDNQEGSFGNDVVWGNLGNDTLDGFDGNDQVRGGQGDDVISGGNGNDFISGDRGNDTETGGAGADIFHGSQDAGIDKVMDF